MKQTTTGNQEINKSKTIEDLSSEELLVALFERQEIINQLKQRLQQEEEIFSALNTQARKVVESLKAK